MTERKPDDRRAEIARVRSALAATSGRRRVELILDARDPGLVVRALPADELWFTIHEAGLADASELVKLASPEQMKLFLDLEVWRGSRPEPRRALPWLRAARAGGHASDDEHDRWAAKLRAIDVELLDLLLMDTLRVHDLEQDPDPEIQSDRFTRTPDGRFILEFDVDGADYSAVRGLVDDLYAEDAFLAGRVLAAATWRLRSELEETALRWRTGRLQDLGHPPLEEALSWFARPARAAATGRAGLPQRPRGFFLAPVPRGSLLDDASARLSSGARDRLQLELVTAANAVLVADDVDLHDLDAVRAAVAAARAMVELGLEGLSEGGDAAATLASTPVKALFQAGFARVLELRWRAERLVASGRVGPREAPLLDQPLGEGVVALLGRRPRFHPGLAGDRARWGAPESGAEAARPFLSASELRIAGDALAAAEALGELAERLGLVDLPGRPERIRLSAAYLTALANERLGRGFRPSPLAPTEAAAAARAVADPSDPRLREAGEAGALLESLARARAEELAPILDGTLPLEAALGGAALWFADER